MKQFILCLLIMAFSLPMITAEPVFINYNGMWGYFIPKDEFDLILKMMIEWEGRGKIINNLDLQIDLLNERNKKMKRERDLWRAGGVITFILCAGFELWSALGRR